jgi:hypothetical protein
MIRGGEHDAEKRNSRPALDLVASGIEARHGERDYRRIGDRRSRCWIYEQASLLRLPPYCRYQPIAFGIPLQGFSAMAMLRE